MNRGLNEEEKEIWGWIFHSDKEQVQNPMQWRKAVLSTLSCSPRKLKNFPPLTNCLLADSFTVHYADKGQLFHACTSARV